MALPTRSYEVVGEHSAPKDFMDYILRMFAQRELPRITAKRADVDELAAQRGDTNTQIEFDLLVRETYHGDNLVVSGYMVTNGVQGSWIAIEVTDRVRFDILG